MPDERTNFDRLIEQVRQGSQEAAWDLIEQYGPRLVRIVRRQLPHSLRSKFDSLDFVQAAWASFFAQPSRVPDFAGEEQFVAFVAAVVSNKVKTEVRRRLHSQKYNVQRERSFDSTVSVAANEATPSQIAMARERWFSMLEDQSDRDREIVEMRFHGYTRREIASRLGVHENTVQRVLQRMLQKQGDEG